MRKNASATLEDHIQLTYLFLRIGVGILALFLPLVLAAGGFFVYRLSLQDSISAYYHAFIPSSSFPDIFAIEGYGLMRNWFVGILWAIGFFLILYKCFGRRESRANFNNRPNGAFTYYALRSLNTLPPGATYRDWHAAIRSSLPSTNYPQKPQLD